MSIIKEFDMCFFYQVFYVLFSLIRIISLEKQDESIGLLFHVVALTRAVLFICWLSNEVGQLFTWPSSLFSLVVEQPVCWGGHRPELW